MLGNEQLVERGMKLPVIFITAHDESVISEVAEAAGAVACLVKPFAERTLLEAIGRALDRPIRCMHS